MKFSKSEMDIIYQYAAPTKAETLAGMKEIVPVIKDLLTKAIVEQRYRNRLCRGMTCQEKNGSDRKPAT